MIGQMNKQTKADLCSTFELNLKKKKKGRLCKKIVYLT